MDTQTPGQAPVFTLNQADRPGTTSEAGTKLTYRPEIDGLRAVAIIPVILFHMGIPGMAGGNLGVDVFFVISGFLIMTIVKREADAGAFSFKRFWARRVRRIMPAMVAAMIASLLFTYFFVFLPEQIAVGRQAAWAMLSAANIYFWNFVGDYWGWNANKSPLLHMWSLAVEEQFYLFVPPAVWLIYRFAPRRLFAVVAVIGAASLALFLYEAPRHPLAVFYLLPARAWELAAGCALAIVGVRDHAPGRAVWNSILSLLGLGMIIASYSLVKSLGPGVVLPVAGAVLVIAFSRSGVCHAILSNPLPVYIGKLSYSLYLWHWPVIVFPVSMGHHLPMWMTVALTCVLSAGSYYLVETPTRHAKKTVPFVLLLALFTTLAAVAMGTIRRTYDISGFEKPQIYVNAYDCNPNLLPPDANWADMNFLPGHAGKSAYKEGGIRPLPGVPKVVLLGDSHGTFWSPIVNQYTDSASIPASFWAMSGVSPFCPVPATPRPALSRYLSKDDTFQYDQARINLLKEWKPHVVIIAVRWNGNSYEQVRDLINYVHTVADQVLLIEQPPELSMGTRNVMDYLCYKGFVPRDGVKQYFSLANVDGVEKGRALIRRIAGEHPNCTVVPTHDLYLHGKESLVLDGRQVVYMDDDHLTYYGASLAKERIHKAIADALAK